MREDDEATGYQPVDPTTPVLPDPYPYHISEPTTPDLYSGDEIGIPPPPPHVLHKPTTSRAPMILGVSLAIVLLLFAAAGVFYLARTYAVNKSQLTPIVRFVEVTPTPAPTQQPTRAATSPSQQSMLDQNYTATDIFQDGVALRNLT